MTDHRPGFIRHWTEILAPTVHQYPGSQEQHVQTADLSSAAGMTRVGVNVDVLAPGRRTGWPHAEGHEEEFVFVLKGFPQAWIDGHVFDLKPGDFVGFPAGTGIGHTIINNTDDDVHLLVGGERDVSGARIHYLHHPARNAEIGARHWPDAPAHPQGPHDGLPDALRNKGGTRD